jgi:hypothetical protein
MSDEKPVDKKIKAEVEALKAETAAELPPAGDAQREELKKRAAALMAEAELIMGQLGVGAIDPAKLDSDTFEREVMAAMDFASGEVFVSNADPNYRYAWIYRDPRNQWGGRAVRQLQAIGWQVVSGSMKEAEEHKAVTGERWVSDCLLMRCRVDRYAQLQVADREKRLRQADTVAASFFNAADKRGVRVFDQNTMPGHIRSQIESQAIARRPEKRRVVVPTAQAMTATAAQQLAKDRLNLAIKQGTVPGLTVNDAVRR